VSSIGVLMALILTGGTLMAEAGVAVSLLEALRADGPFPGRADAMTLYGPLLEDWDVEVVDYATDGSRRTSRGEWLFGWVLEGRAIQDVFIVPSRGSRQVEQPVSGNRYGMTLRVYDPARDAWQVTWINPVSGVRTLLVGRKQGDEIVQEGRNEEGSLIRWIFADVTRSSFRWRGEASSDAGETWRLEAEFFARRRAL